MTIDTTKNDSFSLPAEIWCTNVAGIAYSFDQFLDQATAFHGNPSPGLLLGGKMVDMALAAMPKGAIFDAVAETGKCLPDAIQMLTPCTVGNGWLKVLELDRYAIALYEKYSGQGVRVFLHPRKLTHWQEIDTWFFKRKPKEEQDGQRLFEQIRQAGERLFGLKNITVSDRFKTKVHLGAKGLCPCCREIYPVSHGECCRACQGNSPYLEDERGKNGQEVPFKVTSDKGA